MPNPTPQSIVEKLSEAQRRVILRMDAKFRLPRDIGVHTNALLPLMDLWRSRRGIEEPIQLVSRDYVDWPRLAWTYALTDLGLEVQRAILSRKEQNDG